MCGGAVVWWHGGLVHRIDRGLLPAIAASALGPPPHACTGIAASALGPPPHARATAWERVRMERRQAQCLAFTCTHSQPQPRGTATGGHCCTKGPGQHLHQALVVRGSLGRGGLRCGSWGGGTLPGGTLRRPPLGATEPMCVLGGLGRAGFTCNGHQRYQEGTKA